MAVAAKPKREKKYKTHIKVLDNRSLQGVCSCGWEQPIAVLQTDLSVAMASVQSEIQAHNHIPAPKKEKKNAKSA